MPNLPASVKAIPICILSATSWNNADAYELNAGVGIEMGYTDNVELQENGDSGAPVELFANFRYYDRSPLTEGLVEGSLGYRNDLAGNSSDEIRPNMRGNLLWHLDPDRLTWELDGVITQARTRQTEPDSPNNREVQAVILTGPELTTPLSSVTRFNAAAKAGYAYSENSDNNSFRFRAAARLETQRTPTATLSGNLEAEAVQYQESSGSASEGNFGTEERFRDSYTVNTFVGLENQQARLSTLGRIGVTFVNQENSSGRANLFLQGNATAQLDRINSAGLRLSVRYTDEGNRALERRTLTDDTATPREDNTANIFLERRAEGFYKRSGKRVDFTSTIRAVRRSFVKESRDDTRVGGGIKVTRRFTRQIAGSLTTRYDYTDFDDTSLHYHDYRFLVGITRKIGRWLSTEATIGHQFRSSNESAQEYDETAIFASLIYELPL